MRFNLKIKLNNFVLYLKIIIIMDKLDEEEYLTKFKNINKGMFLNFIKIHYLKI